MARWQKKPDPYYLSPEWKALRLIVRARSHGWCEVPGCTNRAVVCDHIIARKQGGADDPSNLRDLCREHDNQVMQTAKGERRRNGVFSIRGCDANGDPIDPAHPWKNP